MPTDTRPAGFVEVIRAVNNLVYSRVGVTFAACGYGAIGAGFLIAGVSEGRTAFYIVGAAAILVGLFVTVSGNRFLIAVEQARAEQTHPNPLAGALLALDWVDASRLRDLGAQMDVLPAPIRKERSRGRRRSVGLNGPSSYGSPSASHESSSTDTAIYELGDNPSRLLKDLVGELRKRDQIQLDVADVPQVSIDQPLNEDEIEALLVASLAPQQGLADSTVLARQVAEILGPGLPLARLSATKSSELSELILNSFVLIESMWRLAGSKDSRDLLLSALHPPEDSAARSEGFVEMPADVDVRVRLPNEALTPRLLARTDAKFQAGVFGEVISVDPLIVWPLAIFARSP
jgi:hypothetical protein